MVNLNNQYLYAKGTCDVVVRDIVTGDVDYQSNKVQTNQFTTTADMGAIQAGIGNTTAINIPHNSAVNLTLTNATPGATITFPTRLCDEYGNAHTIALTVTLRVNTQLDGYDSAGNAVYVHTPQINVSPSWDGRSAN